MTRTSTSASDGSAADRLVPPDAANTLAVVVTYHPDEHFVRNLTRLLEQVDRVLIVDNTPDELEPHPVRLASMLSGVDVIRMGGNVGVASALNVGVREMKTGGFEWLLTLDQDTLLRSDHLALVHQAVESTVTPEVGLIGVNYEIAGQPVVSEGEGAVETPAVITSGTLLRAACAHACGPFRDDYFIDSVDTEYSLRARRSGFSVWITERIGMEHGLGEVAVRRFLGRDRLLFNYPPLRLYFIVRNGIVTLLSYGPNEREWAKGEIHRIVYKLVMGVLAEDNRFRKLRAVMSGLWDGVWGAAGGLLDCSLTTAELERATSNQSSGASTESVSYTSQHR